MRKEKIYLDTSVISYLDQQDSPEKMKETHIFWELLKTGLYDVYISNIVFEELNACIDIKRKKLLNYISEIDYNFVLDTQESLQLANEYITTAILTDKSYTDCRHIALASIYECDYITSWNFKHMANINTMKKVNSVNMVKGYREVKIYPPTEFLYEER
ncbi:MAG: twitching motility protein PilT [Epulopiscium sp. Nele67-Bin004]|nr:MAG: twitching motility protein PilT [Epulopiscium sp. Nele67-Bin004]